MSDIEQELGWMKRSPYTEGWPKRYRATGHDPHREGVEVVPLSDAERLRGALERIAKVRDQYPGIHVIEVVAEMARAALDREGVRGTTNPVDHSLPILDREGMEGMEGMEDYIPDWVPPERRPDREGEE
jgi:hypothetical protein